MAQAVVMHWYLALSGVGGGDLMIKMSTYQPPEATMLCVEDAFMKYEHLPPLGSTRDATIKLADWMLSQLCRAPKAVSNVHRSIQIHSKSVLG